MKQKIIIFFSVPIVLIIVLVTVVGGFIGSLVAIMGGGEEDSSDGVAVYEDFPISPEVEALRDEVLQELKKYGKEAYINLFLAVVMQESGGLGEDVFQCSESLGKAPNSISKKQSIKQGTKYLNSFLDHEKVRVSSPLDLEKIKVALQAYNYGGGYIDYINDEQRLRADGKLDTLGKWTQENALAYQKKKAGSTVRSGSQAELLGPYAYGDAYYVSHVLRYYQTGNDNLIVQAGEAAKVPYLNRQKFLFGSGPIPLTPDAMEIHLKTITVPIYDGKRNTTMNLTVHMKLAEEFQAVFEDMAKAKFPIKASETCAYVWKTIIGTGTVSQHSYGVAIDINWNDNPCFYNTNVDVSKGYGGYQPGKNKYSVTKSIIKIWESHGFYWGGYWAGKKDTMHFSYTEPPG